MATPPKWRQHNRKRQQAEAELSQDDLLPSKRFKRSPAFWDNLSKVPLTRSALKELERRYALSDRSCVQPKIKKPRTRSAVREFKQKAQLIVPVSEYLPKASQADISILKVFATQQRRGGPDLTDLRGYPRHTMSSSLSSSKRRRSTGPRSTDPSSTTSKSKKSTTPYDRGFEQKLVDGGVYPDEYEYPDGRVPSPPDNWEEFNQRLMQPRPSLSPSQFSDEAFRKFKRANAHAFKEKQVTTSVIPIIEGEIRDAKCVAGDILFTNLDHLTDGTLAPGKPDLFYGARPEQLDRRIRDELSGSIIPSTQEDLPMAPNFFLAVKGPDGSAAVAKRQACYDGALGARGMQSLQSYGQDEPVHDKNAYTIASTYHDGQLKMFTTHIIPPAGPGKPPEYQMTQLNTWGLTGNADTFRQGATAFRNGRDLAKEWRDQFITAANERVDSLNAKPSTIESSDYNGLSDAVETYHTEDSETSADELAPTRYPVEKPKTSADEIVFSSFSHPVEDDISADELDHTYVTPIVSVKRRRRQSKK